MSIQSELRRSIIFTWI